MHNAFITSVEFGDLDYTSDDLNEVTIKVRYDYAVLNDPTTGGGAGDLTPVEVGNLSYAAGVGENPERQD